MGGLFDWFIFFLLVCFCEFFSYRWIDWLFWRFFGWLWIGVGDFAGLVVACGLGLGSRKKRKSQEALVFSETTVNFPWNSLNLIFLEPE